MDSGKFPDLQKFKRRWNRRRDSSRAASAAGTGSHTAGEPRSFLDLLNLGSWIDPQKAVTYEAKFIRHMSLGGRGCREQDGAVAVHYASQIVGGGVTLYLFFAPDDEPYAGIRCYDMGTVPAEDTVHALRLCNRMNLEHPWVKFALDEDNDILVSAEAALEPRTAGAALEELCSRLVVSMEDAWPEFHRRT